jgi:hypothetical protein
MERYRRLYGLYEKVDGKWVRLYPELSYTLQAASRVFQNKLLEQAFGQCSNERRLRPTGQKVVMWEEPKEYI